MKEIKEKIIFNRLDSLYINYHKLKKQNKIDLNIKLIK